MINAVACTEIESGEIYSNIINKFNKYSQENNLDITLKLTLFTSDNSTVSFEDYESSLEYLFQMRSQKYDLIFYDSVLSIKYSNYLLNLKEWIPEKHFDEYVNGIASQSCVYNGKWVGLVIYIYILINKYIYIYIYCVCECVYANKFY